MNSARSPALNAHVSITCAPWVLIILFDWPRPSRTAFPCRAGIVVSSPGLVIVRRPLRDHDAPACAARSSVGRQQTMPRRTGQVQSALGVERAEPDRARDLLEPRLPARILVQITDAGLDPSERLM